MATKKKARKLTKAQQVNQNVVDLICEGLSAFEDAADEHTISNDEAMFWADVVDSFNNSDEPDLVVKRSDLTLNRVNKALKSPSVQSHLRAMASHVVGCLRTALYNAGSGR
jgi:hypothetical protein